MKMVARNADRLTVTHDRETLEAADASTLSASFLKARAAYAKRTAGRKDKRKFVPTEVTVVDGLTVCEVGQYAQWLGDMIYNERYSIKGKTLSLLKVARRLHVPYSIVIRTYKHWLMERRYEF